MTAAKHDQIAGEIWKIRQPLRNARKAHNALKKCRLVIIERIAERLNEGQGIDDLTLRLNTIRELEKQFAREADTLRWKQTSLRREFKEWRATLSSRKERAAKKAATLAK